MKHKWHKEICAWANGAEIEGRLKHDDYGEIWGKWHFIKNPTWEIDCAEYRIKPQPKEPQYLYVYGDFGKTMVSTYDGKDFMLSQINDQMAKLSYIGKIKLENDDAD